MHHNVSTRLNSTQLNSTQELEVLDNARTQLNSTQLDSTQLNSIHQLNSTQELRNSDSRPNTIVGHGSTQLDEQYVNISTQLDPMSIDDDDTYATIGNVLESCREISEVLFNDTTFEEFADRNRECEPTLAMKMRFLHLKSVPNCGGGNCFYRACAQALRCNEMVPNATTHLDVRYMVGECVRNHVEWIRDELVDDSEFVTNCIMTPGKWAADSYGPLAIAKIYDCMVVMLYTGRTLSTLTTPDGKQRFIDGTRLNTLHANQLALQIPIIVLMYNGNVGEVGNHFVWCQPTSTQPTAATLGSSGIQQPGTTQELEIDKNRYEMYPRGCTQ